MPILRFLSRADPLQASPGLDVSFSPLMVFPRCLPGMSSSWSVPFHESTIIYWWCSVLRSFDDVFERGAGRSGRA